MSMWLVAKTPTSEPYPCRCPKGDEVDSRGRKVRCRTRGSVDFLCPCWGRTDIHDGLPATCCGRKWVREHPPVLPITDQEEEIKE